MKKSINANNLAKEIEKRLTEYTEEVERGVRKAVDITSEETNEAIKGHVTFGGSGKYVRAFRITMTRDSPHHYEKTWHVRKPHYRLTHLLENGHQLTGGGRTKAYPHISFGEEIAEARMEDLTMEAIKNAGH